MEFAASSGADDQPLMEPAGRAAVAGEVESCEEGAVRRTGLFAGVHPRTLTHAPDGRTVISGSRDRTVRIWDAVRGTERARLLGHSAPVASVAISPDGRTIASGGGADAFKARDILDGRPDESGEVKLWGLADGRLLATPLEKTGPVTAVAFSPDGGTLAIGKEDGTIDLWDRARGRIRTLPPDDLDERHSVHGVVCLSYSPDGRRLAVGRQDRTIRIRELGRGEAPPSGTLRRGEVVPPQAFSPDGKSIAACDRAGRIIVWSATTGQELGRLEGPTDGFSTLAFSPDGRSLAGGNRDTSISIFALEGAIRPTR